MKYNKYFLILLLLFKIETNSQKISGKITYIASTKKALDYRNNNDGNLKIKNDVNEIYKKANDVKVILNFNEVLSEYYVIDKLEVGDVQNINITHIMAGSEKK